MYMKHLNYDIWKLHKETNKCTKRPYLSAAKCKMQLKIGLVNRVEVLAALNMQW